MRFLILSDLHANWQALEAVLQDAEGQYEQVVCCGDLVGYNPDPKRVLNWTRQNCVAVIRGNHDKVVAGLEGLEWFNDVAQIAARWTMDQLDDSDLEYLRELQKGPVQAGDFLIWHGSPRDEDEYVSGTREAGDVFPYFDGPPLGFFGHTHIQGIFFSKHRRLGGQSGVPRNTREFALELQPDTLYMINPGSVGQPRDGDSRAAYALYDSTQKVVCLRRVKYPFQVTAKRILMAGLPDVLALRLSHGI